MTTDLQDDLVAYTYNATSEDPGRPNAFYTSSEDFDFGVQVTTRVCGVFGSTSDASGLGRVSPLAGTGVQGNGGLVGVVGESNTGSVIGPSIGPGTPVTQGVGVYGRGAIVGVYGDSQANFNNLNPSSQGNIGVYGVGTTAGIEGKSLDAGNGVQGFSSNSGISPSPQVPGAGVFGQGDNGPGVSGQSTNGPGVSGIGSAGGGVFTSNLGAGVTGHSDIGYGGIFESFDPDKVTHSAQMRIVPAVPREGEAVASFPRNPQLGDFFVRTVRTTGLLPHRLEAQLWFFANFPAGVPNVIVDHGWVRIV